MKLCVVCKTELPDQAKFCFNCGAPQPQSNTQVLYPIDRYGNIAQQLIDHFFKAFKERIDIEHRSDQYAAYSELLYRSGFRETVHLRADQLAREIEQTDKNTIQLSQWIKQHFEDLLDYFIVHFGTDLNQFNLSDKILKYQGRTLGSFDLFDLVMDYLNFGEEQETFYTDFFRMPPKKIKNASQHFLFAAKSERIFFISDQTFLGTCKEGFAMSDQALYWKNHLQKATTVRYDQLENVKIERKWLSVNNAFFNVNPSINFKMMKLLKKLRQLHQTALTQ